ncbi:hypothetical protein LEP1GSC012_3540 [Leptospira interrogans serovar Valbuzzi str. Valbuzzi]|nr:hypothetical protein LEP1GSC012_3540 [Leptospira interrogans serovar Valbuzzi str. Valbuzzi]
MIFVKSVGTMIRNSKISNIQFLICMEVYWIVYEFLRLQDLSVKIAICDSSHKLNRITNF